MTQSNLWLVPGMRTPFSRIDGAVSKKRGVELSSLAVLASLRAAANPRPDLFVWGTVIPNLHWSNIAREVLIDAGMDQTVPAFSTVLACSTSMAGAFEAAGQLRTGHGELALVGGVECMSHVQVGLSQGFSDWLRRFGMARSWKDRFDMLERFPVGELRLHRLSVINRVTGKSMGEHCEEMAKAWNIGREAQDRLSLQSHQNAVTGQTRGFFDDLIASVDGAGADTFPRGDTSLERLRRLNPVFDRMSGKGTITAGNASPLTDGAAALWIATDVGVSRLPTSAPRVRLVDWEIAAVNIFEEGLLMAPAYAIPRLLSRNGFGLADIQLWEIHEAFAAQLLCNVAAIESRDFLRDKAGVDAELGRFPWERLNPNGGSIALGHPFGATGARILSQAAKELSAMPSGSRAVVSICADGGLGTVALLEAA